MTAAPGDGLTVAVTGPTGEIGRSFVRALDRDPAVARIVGMARSPFDPGRAGLKKVEYLQGDILDRSSVDRLVTGVDVVAHLAFLIFGSPEGTREVNLQGSRNVFESAFDAGVARLVYTSSVAAYGFHPDNPTMLTEDVEPRGSEGYPYSIQKAEVEILLRNLGRGRNTDIYVFRPCIVAGPSALALIEKMPYIRISEKLPGPLKKVVGGVPLLRPIVPEPGIPFQLVHEDDVGLALAAAVRGDGPAGDYNLAADGQASLTDLAHALGWYSIPVPEIAVDATATIVSKMPYLPVEAKWINALRVPVLMDCTKAKTELGWAPRHDALETLAETVAAARAKGLVPWPGRV